MSTEIEKEELNAESALDHPEQTAEDAMNTGQQSQLGANKTLLSQQRQRQLNEDQEQQEGVTDKMGATGMAGGAAETLDVTAADGDKAMTTTKKKKRKPAYLQSLNESEKQANFKIIEKMNKKISFLKNPRFRVNKSPIIMTDAMKNKAALEAQSIKSSSFRVEPPILNFHDYQVNNAYEIPLKITNVAHVSKRIKFIPPQSENFTISGFKYPNDKIGDIAPGMSLLMTIAFSAPSFADFDDIITFVTEETSFKIPMRARRDPPKISLVNPMDCMNSWLGDKVDMAFRCINTGGDGGFKFFCEKDEDDQKQTDADTIRIGSFTLTQSEFYLYSGSAIDIYVSFSPEQEGKLEENLILACDNQTSEFYKLTGYGAMMDLDIIAVDGKEVNFKENPFETVYFENTNPTSENKRIIRVKNTSPILVPFHWSVYKQKNQQTISLENEDTHYRVEPAQGKIQGGQYIDFEIYFCPQHAEPYYEFADLIIEDIPITSVRDPPEGLKSFAQANKSQNTKVPMPTYVGSNTQFLSIPMIQFNLRGQGNSCKVEVEPSYCLFEGDTYINHEYSQSVVLKKRSEGQVRYQLRLEGKNRESFEVDIQTQGKSLNNQNEGVIYGVIEASEEEIILNIVVQSKERGECMAYFYIEIEDGAPISFQVVSNFIGPIVSCNMPIVDYGLVKVNTTEDFEIQLCNQSPVPADVLLKKSANQRLNFENMISIEFADPQNKDSSVASLVYDRPLQTKGSNLMFLDQYNLHLKPFEKQNIIISLKTHRPEKVEEYFEIMVKDGKSQFFQLHSEVQCPHVQLNRVIMNLGRIYAGVTEYINPQSKHQKAALVLKNFGNVPAHFRWQQKNDPEKVICKFEPSTGVIQPRQEMKIKMTVTVFTGGNLNELFLCDIVDMELPIGFEMLADAYGLNVSYETQEDQTANLNQTQMSIRSKKSENPTSNALKMLAFPNCTINKTSSQKFILKNLSGIKTSFLFDVINFAPTDQIAPKEKSGVEKAKEEAELRAQKKKLEEEEGGGQNTTMKKEGKKKKKVGFANTSQHGFQTGQGSDVTQMRNRPILSDEHEQTQKFSSAVGETFTKTKQLEKDQGFYLQNNKGLAIVFNPHMGELPPNSEIPVTVTIYNNVCGKFDDIITSQVKGLSDVEFPVSISITGSPIRVPPNQVGLNYNTIPPTLPIPTIVAKSKPVSKSFVIKNTGINSVQIDWKIFDQNTGQKAQQMAQQMSQSHSLNKNTSQNKEISFANQEEDQEGGDLFDIDIVKNFAFDKVESPFKFEFQAIEPEPTKDSAFKIEPASCVVGSRSTHSFVVTFDPLKGTGGFQSILLASPELSQEELEIQRGGQGEENTEQQKKGALGIIALNLDALTIDPVLSIDRKHKMDGQHHMRLKYWSVQGEADAPKKIQKLTYTNDSKADLTFNLNINGPFEIVKTKTNSGAVHPLAGQDSGTKSSSKVLKQKVETMFCLQPLKIVEVHVKFLAPSPSDGAEWPMTIYNERAGELISYFQNGDQQKLFLDGVLMRPKIQILTDFLSKNDYAMDELDFGRVNVEKSRKIHVYLSNETDVTAKWQLNYVKFPKKSTIGHNTTTPWEVENMEKTDDAEVFEFSVTEGALKGKSLPLRKVPEGLLVPPVPKDDEEKKYLPQTITVKFKPKQNVLYKSKFRFMCETGIACDVILKGRGSYEENYD